MHLLSTWRVTKSPWDAPYKLVNSAETANTQLDKRKFMRLAF